MATIFDGGKLTFEDLQLLGEDDLRKVSNNVCWNNKETPPSGQQRSTLQGRAVAGCG